jgi:hypothetical protein
MAAIFIASVNPVLFRVLALVLCGLGLSLFVTAKLSVIRQGILVSFGSRQMSTRHRRMYRVGYALMVTGWFLGIGAVLREAILTQVAK